mgnify:CR=1 FL=1
MLKELIKLANHLDSKGLKKEADHLDRIVVKLAQSGGFSEFSTQEPVSEQIGPEQIDIFEIISGKMIGLMIDGAKNDAELMEDLKNITSPEKFFLNIRNSNIDDMLEDLMLDATPNR